MLDAASGHTGGMPPAAGDEVTETLKRSGESLDHITREGLRCYSDAMAAAMQSGMETSRMFADLGNRLLWSRDLCTSPDRNSG